MRNGTKIGLILIGLAYIAASTGLSLYAVAKARAASEQRMEILNPRVMFCCGQVPAGTKTVTRI